MKIIQAGTGHKQTFFPGKNQTVAEPGNHGVNVVATSSLILYFEEVANNLVKPYFENGEVAVGTHVNVNHLAAANISQNLSVTAILTKQLDYRAVGQPYAKQRLRQQYGEIEHYGWSDDKARQYSVPQRSDFGEFIRNKGFCLD